MDLKFLNEQQLEELLSHLEASLSLLNPTNKKLTQMSLDGDEEIINLTMLSLCVFSELSLRKKTSSKSNLNNGAQE